jgi:hypothetical protein
MNVLAFHIFAEKGNFDIGMQTAMTDDWKNHAVTEVLESLDEERSRTRAGFNLDGIAEKVGKFSSSKPQAETIWQSTDPDVNNLRVGSGFDNIWRAVFRIRIRIRIRIDPH